MDNEFNLAFLRVKDILYDLAGQNDLLFLDLEYDEWNLMLKKRSEKIREIFQSYVDTILFINTTLDKNDPILYDIAYKSIAKFKEEEIHDSGFIIPIMEKLIAHYERQGNRHRLLFVYLNYGYECMEYYLRMGNFSYKEKVRDSFLKILKLKEHYLELTNAEKARFFIAYYNLTSALPDVVEEYQKDIVYYYQDLLDFCFKDSIKIHIEENEDAIDEIYYVVEAFLYGFARYLDKNALYRDEYFHLVERTLNSFPLNAIGHVISVLLNVVLRREVFFSFIFFDSMISSSVMIPASLDIAIAVKRLSPVTILTVIPALLHVAIEDGTSVRRGSVIPIMN